MEPAQLYTPVIALPLPLPRHLLTEPRALSTLGTSDVSSTPRPLYSNFRTHSTSLGIPPPSRRGKHGQCALHVPSAHFDAPEHATRLHHENLAGLSLISPTPQLRQTKGLVAHTLSPFPPARPLQVIRAPRSSTPLPPFGIGPPNIPMFP